MSDESNSKASGTGPSAGEAAAVLGALGAAAAGVAVAAGTGALLVPLLVGGAASGLAALVSRAVSRGETRRPMVFISYSRDRGGDARVLEEVLRESGMRTWLDVEKLQPGENFEAAVDQAIRTASAVMVLSGRDRDSSKELAAEVRRAAELGKPIILIESEDARTPLYGNEVRSLARLSVDRLERGTAKGLVDLLQSTGRAQNEAG